MNRQLFITSADDLSACIPNKIAPAVGEPSIFEKIRPYIETAQFWAEEHLCSVEFAGDNEALNEALRGVVGASALCDAIGGLDLIVTPNGFGVVSTDTIAPASRERVEFMRRDLSNLRDSRIHEALTILQEMPEWKDTQSFRMWTRCLYLPTWPIFKTPGGRFSLERYNERSEALAAKEWGLATAALSLPLLERLRVRSFNLKAMSRSELYLAKLVREIARRWAFESDPPCLTEYWQIVDTIRRDDELFEIWKTTPQSKRYALPGFENKKSSTAFFF